MKCPKCSGLVMVEYEVSQLRHFKGLSCIVCGWRSKEFVEFKSEKGGAFQVASKCIVEGCQKLAQAGKDQMCCAHYNKAHGINPVHPWRHKYPEKTIKKEERMEEKVDPLEALLTKNKNFTIPEELWERCKEKNLTTEHILTFIRYLVEGKVRKVVN